jgi:hypothetical protein
MNIILYIDPGAGSYFFQMLIGAFLGGVYLCKIYFLHLYNILKNVFLKIKKNRNDI